LSGPDDGDVPAISALSLHIPFRSPQDASLPVPMPPERAGTVIIQDIMTTPALTHLDRLEAESIHIFREVAAQFRNPVLLYSIGKDSTVLLHLMRKAFFPARPPIPLLHIDSTYEFRQTYEFRDRVPERLNVELRVHINEEGVREGINPFEHGATVYTDIMRTQGLRQALERGGYDCAIGGARRDEEKSRAKERIFSFRDSHQRWDPKNQRPEFWDLYNGRIHKGESVRAFPLSNWTELDVWLYILREGIELPPLYFAEERPIVDRDGVLIMVDDERMPLRDGETPMRKKVRFRTLGCYPLTGGIESEADTLEKIVAEMLTVTTSERQGRVIDHDPSASMEKKKQEGYF
jgi:sulfate adenylyltransferase subunit 2